MSLLIPTFVIPDNLPHIQSESNMCNNDNRNDGVDGSVFVFYNVRLEHDIKHKEKHQSCEQKFESCSYKRFDRRCRDSSSAFRHGYIHLQVVVHLLIRFTITRTSWSDLSSIIFDTLLLYP